MTFITRHINNINDFGRLQIDYYLFFHSVHLTLASYLDIPRIYFFGQYRADVSTVNNNNCCFEKICPPNNTPVNWNANGTGEFYFFDTNISGAVNKNGEFTQHEPVIGAKIFDNGKSPFAKLVDIDVDAQYHSTLFGMRFGIGWEQTEDSEQNLAFKGEWSPNVLVQNWWPGETRVSATTTITNISWYPENDRNSTILKDLRKASLENGNTLQVSISLYNYAFYPDLFGYVVGTIGIYKEGEPLNYGGERLLNRTNWSPMYKAAFKVHENSSSLTVDLSNALPLEGINLVDIGTLFLAIIRDERQCVEPISNKCIPYLNTNWFNSTSGVVDYRLSPEQLNSLTSSATLVVVQRNNTDEADYSECGQNEDNKFIVLLNEVQYYVRPTGLYRAQLEHNEAIEIPMYVTHLGKPAENILIGIAVIENLYGVTGSGYPKPENGVTVEGSNQSMKTTNSSGLVTFAYRVAKEMSTERYYDPSPCEGKKWLPIDGQVYRFIYGVCTTETNCTYIDEVNDSESIVIKGMSSTNASRPYTWERDVYPIFHQYYLLYPVMGILLNLSDYDSVTKYQNLNLLKHAMGLNINDPNYMPAGRDISPSKQQMILDWLDNTIRNITQMSFTPPDSDETVPVMSSSNCYHPSTASAESDFDRYSYCEDENIDFVNYDYLYDDINDSLDNTATNCTRPLLGYTKNSQNPNIQALCTIENLQEQLQEAVELEFATIPLYLTSLYSIVDGCNSEIYDIIRSVVIQEMLHMVQAANILIATGGTPIVDNASFVPRFPGRLPGCVHPNLKVYLDKLNIIHVHDVFTILEAPDITRVSTPVPLLSNHTIGQFYYEIENCIETLGDKIFQPEKEEKQVNWPWTLQEEITVGTVHIVTNMATAIDGIKEIIEQGEGTDPLNPDDLDAGQLAHYYRFQEIVCGKKLINTSDDEYAYKGDDITYDPLGVWPMRPNPGAEGIVPGTTCYIEATAFHRVFRALLRDLQTTFSGYPKNIIKVVELMEALQIYTKRVMQVEYNDNYTCGPVWDYNFEVTEGLEETETSDNTDVPIWYYLVPVGILVTIIVLVSVVLLGVCFCVKTKEKRSHTTPKSDKEIHELSSY